MKQINVKSGWFKMYWDLYDDENLTWEAATFLCYLIEIYPILRTKLIDNNKEYKRLGTDFVQSKFPVSRNTINKWLNLLDEQGYIDLIHLQNSPRKPRYYRLSDELQRLLANAKE